MARKKIHVIAPNFNHRLSGVTSTIIQLIPLQRALGVAIWAFGCGLPASLPQLSFWDLLGFWRSPSLDRPHRIWHARRNIEMIVGLVLKKVFRMRLKLLFTSASQRHHTRFTQFLIRNMDGVVATSQKTAAYLKVPHRVILHGIDTERFCPSLDKANLKKSLGLNPKQHYVGCFGRIRHQKGTDLFVDSMIALLKTRPHWSAIILGRATEAHMSYEKKLQEKVRNAGLEHQILFLGEKTDIPLWYQAIDLYVAPQRWEGFGLTPLEAMASGVPVVATDVGAFAELIVSGETGCLIPAQDWQVRLEDMQESILPYLDNAEMRVQQGHNALRHAKDLFPLKREAQELARLYENLANTH